MANKRIELEQYKHYVNLLAEEPNRKVVRKGVTICLIVMMIFCLGFFVLSILSNNLAQNPANILEKPPAKSSTPSVPGSQQLPSGTQLPPETQLPSGTQLPPGTEIPSGTPTPTPGPSGRAPAGSTVSMSDAGAVGLPEGTRGGDLLAQATSTTPSPIEISQPGTVPSSTAPTSSPAKAKKPPLPKQTKGVGNLSNLAKGAGSRGWQIYSLVLAIGLIIVLYLGMRRSRLEGRSK
ncbi:MAG: hypothetical protein ACYC99_03530 [Candidatus Geothermincolia bacterium]